MMKKKLINSQNGFTLIETLLYIGIAALLLFAVGTTAQAFLEARIKNQVIAEVNDEGGISLNLILQTIRNADSISDPDDGITSDTLTLVMPDASKSPTVFKLETDGRLTIKEGTDATLDLTNLNKVLIAKQSGDSGIFSNFSRPLTPGIIRVRFHVTHQPSSNRYFQNFENDFQGAASLR